jgi:acetyltransferase-like isoleucine patch superfamily enzyme
MKPHNYYQSIPPNKYNPLSWISPKAVIGDNVWIGSDVYIGDFVTIGHNVSISNGVKIYDHDNSWHRVSQGLVKIRYFSVNIGDYTNIGSNSVIIPVDSDIVIGDHCIIGALSFVSRSIPSYKVAMGIPAYITRHIDENVIQEKMRCNNE